jgi:exodeoxyribonuclease-1
MTSTSFYFYDLETTSGSPRTGRIMQFAGQRTDENLEPIGEPDNILVKLADDVIPEPDAILVHGITPQQTLSEGITEAELAKYFDSKVAIPGTIFVGFNNIRFDDEFMRRLCYRTFYDPYQWHWKENRSRWDMMDAIRMMRALRPDGLKWPMLEDKPTVKLELMAKENGILHENAHDALSDVKALIGLTQKFKNTQPKLFEYLLQMRDKKKVAELAMSNSPFVYTSGKFSSEYEKTTVVISLLKHPRRDSAVVYDLRHDPTEWLDKSVEELAKHWQVRYGEDLKPLPLKIMHFNKCPAVAPISVLDDLSKKRISIDIENIEVNKKVLFENPEFIKKIEKVLDFVENEQQTKLPLETAVDDQLYDEFWVDEDQLEMRQIRAADLSESDNLIKEIRNKRLREMIPLYKARNYKKLLTPEEHIKWEEYRRKILLAGGESSVVAKFYKRMQEIKNTRKLTTNDEFLLTELQLYVESILPEADEV